MTINYINLVLDEFTANVNDQTNKIKMHDNQTRNNRFQILKQMLKLENLNEEQLSITTICKDFNDIFLLPHDKLTTTDTIMHKIHTKDDKPITSKMYRYPRVHEQEVNKQINKMLDNSVIKPSNSPYNAPLWVVKKKSTMASRNRLQKFKRSNSRRFLPIIR